MPLPCADAETLTELRAMPISMLASDDWPNAEGESRSQRWPDVAACASDSDENKPLVAGRAPMTTDRARRELERVST